MGALGKVASVACLVLLLALDATAARLFTMAGGDSDDHDVSMWEVSLTDASISLWHVADKEAKDFGPYSICYDPLNNRMLQFEKGYSESVTTDGIEHLYAHSLSGSPTRTELSFSTDVLHNDGVNACVYDSVADHFILVVEGSGADQGGSGIHTLAFMTESGPNEYAIEYVQEIFSISDIRGVYIDYVTYELVGQDTNDRGERLSLNNVNVSRLISVEGCTCQSRHGVAQDPDTLQVYAISECYNCMMGSPGRNLSTPFETEMFANNNMTIEFTNIGMMEPSQAVACTDPMSCNLASFRPVSLAFDESPFTTVSISALLVHDNAPFTVTITWGVITPGRFSNADVSVRGASKSGFTSTGANTFEVTLTPSGGDVEISVPGNTPATVQHSGASHIVRSPITPIRFEFTQHIFLQNPLTGWAHAGGIGGAMRRSLDTVSAVDAFADLSSSDIDVGNGVLTSLEQIDSETFSFAVRSICDGAVTISAKADGDFESNTATAVSSQCLFKTIQRGGCAGVR